MMFTRRRWPIVSVSSSKVSTFSIVFVSYRLQKFADTDRLRVNRRPIRKDFFPDRYDFVPIVFTSSSCKWALKSQIFVRYTFSYFWLETGWRELILVHLRASKQNYIEIRGPTKKKKFSSGIEFSTFFKNTKVRK